MLNIHHDHFDQGLQDAETLGELLLLTLNLIALYGEDAPIGFDAGYNNVQSFVLAPPLDVITGEPGVVLDYQNDPVTFKEYPR